MPKKVVIAIVDDDQSVRDALAGLMKSLGYNVLPFERAEDFLNSKRRQKVSCLIADVQMPGMKGPELYDRLAASGEPIPTVLITAYPDEALRARVLRAGVKCYLAKPFSEDDLLSCIRTAVDTQSG